MPDKVFQSQRERQLTMDLAQTAAFQRLQQVSFLGAIDYYNYKKSISSTWYFNRADHVRGVLFLSNLLIDNIDLDEMDRMYVIATAICHDFGHSPFSHSSEKAFRRLNPNIDHHKVLRFVLEDEKFGVRDQLVKYGLDFERIISITEGSDNYLGWIFHNPINVDTVDGMWRFLLSFRLRPPFDPKVAVESVADLRMGRPVEESQIENLDRFWDTKGSFYDEFLVSGVYARFEEAYVDLLLRRKDKVDVDDYLSSDLELAEEIGLTPDLLDSVDRPSRRARTSDFHIEKTVPLNSLSDLYDRYVRRRRIDASAGPRRKI